MSSPILATLQTPDERTSCEVNLNDDGDMKKTLRALMLQGYIILKDATMVEECWEGAVQDLSNHRLVQKIMTANNEDGFVVLHHECYYMEAGQQPIQHNNSAARRAEPMFLAFHLGGQKGVTKWVITCDEGENGEMTEIYVPVEAVAGDIFLCNARHDRSDPAPCIPKDALCNLIRIQYKAKPFP
ncbi:hypothetical protein HO173_007735 [Letharia columbiana]|uniref:Uncharacterized protein n=1 Tax=Letharia columbiana TaxID=112416 RepID=A0A8H6L374_9LECA|nr:uncharacterized protein HO173_007735 [Letharia columbiana]KAF6233905.1 hypothetical protein HO173_007735 [Letharia columbiana]